MRLLGKFPFPYIAKSTIRQMTFRINTPPTSMVTNELPLIPMTEIPLHEKTIASGKQQFRGQKEVQPNNSSSDSAILDKYLGMTRNHQRDQPIATTKKARTPSGIQSQLRSLYNLISENVSSLMERGEHIDEIQQRTKNLANVSGAFAKTAKKVELRERGRSCTLWVLIALAVTLIVAIITVALVLTVPWPIRR
jgi:synaptobrevin